MVESIPRRQASLGTTLGRLLREPSKRKEMTLLSLAAAEGHTAACMTIADLYSSTGEPPRCACLSLSPSPVIFFLPCSHFFIAIVVCWVGCGHVALHPSDLLLDADEDGWNSFTWACSGGHVDTARFLSGCLPNPQPLLQWKDGAGAK